MCRPFNPRPVVLENPENMPANLLSMDDFYPGDIICYRGKPAWRKNGLNEWEYLDDESDKMFS